MATTPPNAVARLFNLANNATTLAGLASVTVSGVGIVIFLVVNLLGGLEESPYIGVFAYVILPLFFVFGLILIPIGMILRYRRHRRQGGLEQELAAYPILDFNDSRLRRVASVFLIMTVVNAVILGSVSFLAVEYSETVGFCGETCHSVMQPEFTAYGNSPHSRVACVECHIGPGASWFVRSKLDGLRQVWKTARNTYHRPILTPLHTLRPARETCEQCHWPGKHHGDKLRVIVRHATDEASTPSYTAMLLKTGGGTMDLGRHGGIHWWHIESDNIIRYVAGDDRRETIRWVELVTPDGEIRTYTRPGEEPPSPEQIDAGSRTMDCIDCHNRPTHLFGTPAKSLDRVLETRPELRQLPYFKKRAVMAIEADYETHAEGVASVESAIIEYYRSEHPEVYSEQQALIEKGAEDASRVFARTSFPEMKTNWQTHPNHIGHDDSPGCWRCHDDELATADGKHMIPMDCGTCHVFLVEDAPGPPDLAALINDY